MRTKPLAACLSLAALAACSALPEPEPGGFSVPAFFEGASVSKGTVTMAGLFTTAFTAGFEGRREGDTFRLDERFVFPDGRRFQRWTLREVSPGLYEGTVETEGGDGQLLPAVPVEGRTTANGAVLAYHGYAPGGGWLKLGFRHEMTARADGTVANHVTVSKWGLPLATSDVVFAKTAEALAASP